MNSRPAGKRRRSRALPAGLAISLSIAWMTTGCIALRNFKDPKERLTTRTAYTLTAREVRADVELAGQDTHNLVANLGVTAGFGRHAEAGVNLAHGVMGVVNVHAKYNFIDMKKWALGVRVGFFWVYPPAIWALPDEFKNALGGVRIVSVPFDVIASFPLWEMAGLHLGLGYVHSDLFGEIETDTDFLASDIGVRKLHIDPMLEVCFAERVTVFTGARILLWGALVERTSMKVEVEEGVIVGARSVEWARMSASAGTSGLVGLEMKFGKTIHLRIYAVLNGLLSKVGLFDSPVLPGVDVYWRF